MESYGIYLVRFIGMISLSYLLYAVISRMIAREMNDQLRRTIQE